MKNQYALYLTDFNPNGTADLIVVDHNFEVVDVINEAVFGVATYMPDASLNSMDKLTIDSIESLDDLELVEAGVIQPIYKTSLRQVLATIAASPVSDGMDTVNTLNKYFNIK